jgi:hypothetical protein
MARPCAVYIIIGTQQHRLLKALVACPNITQVCEAVYCDKYDLVGAKAVLCAAQVA